MRTSSIRLGIAALLLPACTGAPAVDDPSLRVAVVIDGSLTFDRQRDAAVGRAIELLERMAATKLHRWESGTEHLTLISLDALPDIIWQGSLRELKELDHDEWTRRFDARSDFVHCTDVVAAFDLAAEALAEGAGLVGKYVFAFSDLIHEPPTTSVRSCAASLRAPPAGFPWDEFGDVSVSAYWLPADQVLAWRRAADRLAPDAAFKFYSVSESTAVPLPALSRPVVELSEAEMAADRARYLARFRRGIAWVAGVLVGLVALAVVLGFVSRRVQRRMT